jgi:hypothetical protein
MGIVERLGSRERLLAALKLAFDDHLLRSLAEAHQVIVPGFRPAQAPASLLARSMATDCWRNSGLRTDLDQALSRLARPGDALVDGVDADRAVAELATLPDQPRARAVSVLLRSVDDARTPVRDAALVALDRLDAGEIHLAPPVSPPTRPPVADRGRTDRPPVHDERLRDREEARRALAERDRQLRQLRDESTQQELKLQRLRAQLEAERESHERTRKALSEARDAARAAAGGGGGRELKDARKDALGARAEQAKTKTQLDALLRDYSLLQSGVRALEEVVEALLVDHGDTPPAPVRPHKPSRTIDLPPEAKLRLPSSEHHWPRHFRVFVERLAGSPYIERIQPLDFSGATSSRISLEIPDTTLIAQYSDGDRAARFLIQTTATTPGSLHWVRRHLTETYFSSV